MKPRIRPIIVSIVLLLPLPSFAEIDHCPFDEIGSDVLFAVSTGGWDSVWQSIRAPELGDQILEGIREDLLPTILKESQVETDSASMEAKMDQLVQEVDWKSLARSPMSLVIWSHEEGVPMITLRVDSTESDVEQVHGALENLLRVLAGWYTESRVREEDGRTLLSLEVEGEEGDWVYLERSGSSVWITSMHTLDDAVAGEGLQVRPGFADLWSEGGDAIESSLVIDFLAISSFIQDSLESMETEPHSSLVLDETMEELFKDDLETLEKLKQVESDMDFLTGKKGEDIENPLMDMIRSIGSLGLLVSLTGSVDQGLETTTYWRLEPDSDFEEILDSPPLTDRFLSLIEPDLLRGSVYSVPDLSSVYRFFLERIEAFPGGGDLMKSWDDLQSAIELDLAEDLLPALGNEFALLTRRSDQTSFAGFRLVNNESYLILETGKDEKVKELLARLDEVLAKYQLNPTRAEIEGVTFTQLVAGLMGEGAWGWDPESDILVATTNPRSKSLPKVLAQLRESKGFSFETHPRWEDLKPIWSGEATAVSYDNMSTTWQQQVDELKGAKLMLSMMGGGDPITLGIISLAMEIFTGIPAPDVYFRVDTESAREKVSQSLLLFPIETDEDEP